MRVGPLDRLGRQQAAILAEGDEQDAIEQLLGAGQDRVRIDPGVAQRSRESVLRRMKAYSA
jgi:hypothetical protein